MILDILAVIILLITILRHAFKGFVISAVHLAQWIAIAVLSLLYSDNLKQFLIQNTSIEDVIQPFFKNLLLKRIRASGGTLELPDFLKSAADTASSSAAGYAAEIITGIVITVLSLFIIYIGIRLIGALIILIFSRTRRGGVLGVLDGVLGAAAGLLLGLLYVCILLSLLKLALPFLAEGSQTWVQTQMNHSLLASALYTHNLVTVFIRSLS